MMESESCFNTTLVTVYLVALNLRIKINKSFNTTLVTVYRDFSIMLGMLGQFQYNPCYCLSVSIHFNSGRNDQFQYNPCYCLSVSGSEFWKGDARFNTTLVTVYPIYIGIAYFHAYVSIQPLLLFIQNLPSITVPSIPVSIQPLLLFILHSITCSLLMASFNTTLVTVYHRCAPRKSSSKECFNTTLVTVYRGAKKYLQCT